MKNRVRHNAAWLGPSTLARKATVISALAVTSALMMTSCTGSPQTSDPVTSVLQNVSVNLASDATVSSVEGTAISIHNSKDSSTKKTTYAPKDVVNDLPVRVTTQYKTDSKSGSDLKDLKGYSGKVQMQLTVENLTLAPQNLKYDVAGQSRQQPTLVGAPLSVAASTILKGVDPSDIISSQDGADASTNGVVSTAKDGGTVVQWATLLAPPTSGASKTLTLAANVKDFQAPSFDLSVEPGISTDLSLNGLMDSAFNKNPDSQLALQQKTINLISEVNDVLGKAGGTITDVRTNLEATSKTLGVQAAEDLKSSSDSLTGTMRGLKGQLEGLKGSLTSASQQTQSAVLAQLSQTVDTIDAVLGDTSSPAPQVVVDGQGCSAVVKDPGRASSVYSSLMQVSAQLTGYAQASADCRDEVSGSIATSIGPAETNDDVCPADANPETTPLTCGLYNAKKSIDEQLQKVATDSAGQVNGLDDKDLQAASAAQGKLKATLDDIKADTDSGDQDPKTGPVTKFGKLETAIESADGDNAHTRADAKQALEALRTQISDDQNGLNQKLGAVKQQINTLHDAARKAQDEIGTDSIFDTGLLRQNQALANQLCKYLDASENPAPGKLSKVDMDKLRGYLTATPCDQEPHQDANGNTITNPKPLLGLQPQDPMEKRLSDLYDQLTSLVKSTDLADGSNPLAQSIEAARSSFDGLNLKIDAVRNALDGVGGNGSGGNDSPVSVATAMSDLSKALLTAKQQNTAMKTGIYNAIQAQESFKKDAGEALNKVNAEAQKEINNLIDQQSGRVVEVGKQDTKSITEAFNASINGLGGAASQISSDAKGTVEGQRAKTDEQAQKLAAAVNDQTSSALQGIDSATSASTRDLDGATGLLSADLNNVLLDLGDPKVNGSGLLGSMATSASKADSADYQLALASQNAAGYANIRAEDVAGILLQQAQFKASLGAVDSLKPLKLDVPQGATSKTFYSFHIGADA